MNQPFQQLKIDGFRGLQSVDLHDLGQINLIVGTNNSGKTSLIEAISIFCSPLDPFRWLEVSRRRVLLGRTPVAIRPDLDQVKWIFKKPEDLSGNQSFSGKITVESTGNMLIEKLEAKISEIYASATEDYKNEQLNDDENLMSEVEKKGLELKIIISINQEQSELFNPDSKESFQFWEDERFIQRRRNEPLLNSAIVSPAYSYDEVSSLSKLILSDQNIEEELLNLIRLFDDNITNLKILSPSKISSIYLDHKKLGLTPLYIFGDGLKRTLAIAIALYSAKNGVLLIDEIETSIHISALGSVFSWIVQACLNNNIQLFITTHSLEAIDAILQANVNHDNTVAFRLNTMGEPSKRFSGKILNRLRLERGLDVR